MIYSLLFFTAVIGSIACSKKPAEKEKIQYIIGSENKRGPGPFDPTEPPPPPAPLWGSINIILTKKTGVYIHRVFPTYYRHPFFDDREMPLALTKWDIIKIDLEELPQFLTEEYARADSSNRHQFYTCIKSPSDTITNEAFPVILTFFKERKFDAYIIRKWVDQEQEAIKSFDKD